MKLKLFIRDIDKFLSGDYTFCFTVSGDDCSWIDDDPDYIYVCDFDADLSAVNRDQLTQKAINTIIN